MYHYSEDVLKILKWVAIGHEVPITDSDGDQYGEECVFDDCTYDTTENRTEHSATCPQTLARKELVRLGKTLRKYTIEFDFTDTPTEGQIYRLSQVGRVAKTKYIHQSRELWCLEKLTFNVQEWSRKEIEWHIKGWAAPESDWIVTIDPRTIRISQPELFER